MPDASPDIMTVRIRETCRTPRIGRSKFYELIAYGQSKTIKVGTITLISLAALMAFLNRCRA